MFVHFEKSNMINKKIVVTVIWIFAIITIALLVAMMYQELIAERLTHVDSVVNLKTLFGVGVGILLISGLLLESKFARWIVLLLAYISLLSPFMLYLMLGMFMPEQNEKLWTLISIPSIIISLAIIYLLSNQISLKIYSISSRKKSRIKEQVYLLASSIFLLGMYIYYIYIPLLVESVMVVPNINELVNL